MSKKSVFEKQDLSWEKLSDLMVDHDYQRELKLAHVDKIAAEFDPDVFDVVQVSQRIGNSLFILDGQQRCAALRRKGDLDELVPCIIHRGLAKEQEAAMFLKLNMQKNVSTYEKFRARVVAGDPVAVDIEQIIYNRGLKTGPGASVGTVTAVAACEKVYRGYRSAVRHKCPKELGRTLSIIVETWTPTKEALSGFMILGMGMMLLHYNHKIDCDRLKTRLKYHEYQDPAHLLVKAKAMAHMRRGSPSDAVAEIMVGIYNKKLRTGKLTPWRSK